MDTVAGIWKGMDGAFWNEFLHEEAVFEGCEAVVFSPEEVGRNGDLVQFRSEVLVGHADHGFLHDGGCFFVVMHAHEAVEGLSEEWLQTGKAREFQEGPAAFCDDVPGGAA